MSSCHHLMALVKIIKINMKMDQTELKCERYDNFGDTRVDT